MTVQQLIGLLLERVRVEHYGVARTREYCRDIRALTQAIARYGHECEQRDWQFEEAKIFAEINMLLDTIRRHKECIKYLPVYMEAAVDRHIRTRAEELSAEALAIRGRARRVMENMPKPVAGVVVRELTAVEVLGMIYRDLRKGRKGRKGRKVGEQAELGVGSGEWGVGERANGRVGEGGKV